MKTFFFLNTDENSYYTPEINCLTLFKIESKIKQLQ